MKKQINFTMQEELLKKLDSYCEKTGLSRSAVLTFLTANFVAQMEVGEREMKNLIDSRM